MLTQFSVMNYKSIRDQITLDLQATAISEHNDSIICDTDDQVYLPIAVVYGPNGGGKSNVLEALLVLANKVLRPIHAAHDLYTGNSIGAVIPFSFSREKVQAPTEFEVYFRAADAEYKYVLHVKKNKVIYESLDKRKLATGRQSRLYERTSEGVILKGALGKIKISDELSETLPLLSYLGITYGKNHDVRAVICWFSTKIKFLNYGDPLQELVTTITKSQQMKDLVLQMIREIDLDIVDYRIEKTPNIKIYTTHSVAGYKAELELSQESSGTIKLFNVLPHIAYSLLNGVTLVIDELDAKLHPLLLQYIIRLYTDLSVNKHGAQLIFTSHDLSTMNSENFRRDEIWFVAKGEEQNSILYSLVEFKTDDGTHIRKDAKYAKQYLEGKYGADPYFRRIIDWRNAAYSERDSDDEN